MLATIAILLTNIVSGARRFERRRGLSDFATNDLLRHARASTSFDESEYPSIESRQLPHRQQIPPRQRALRPVLRQPSATVRPIPNRKRANRFGSSEEEASNFVQEGWPQQTQNKKRVGVRDSFGHFTRRRQGNSNIRYTKRFGPNDGFDWPKEFGTFNNGHNTNRRFGLDETLGYFSSALRLLSYLVRKVVTM